ncbi:MAG: ribosomal protein S18-alanine N-acetyltransferase [Actinomycetota bacterium]
MRAEADPPRSAADVSVVPMRRKHVRDVLAIERRVYPRPWSAALFFSELSQRKSRYYIVAIAHKEVVGYGGLMVHDDEGHITTIAVLPEHQHEGVGTRMLLDMMDEAHRRNARTVALEVRVANWPAQRLYSWFGFRPIGVRKNYYAETGEDALVMWVDDLPGDEMRARLDRIREAID